MAFNDRNGDSISQINVTPLVDVMLVLLVSSWSRLRSACKASSVNLPQVQSPALPVKKCNWW